LDLTLMTSEKWSIMPYLHTYLLQLRYLILSGMSKSNRMLRFALILIAYLWSVFWLKARNRNLSPPLRIKLFSLMRKIHLIQNHLNTNFLPKTRLNASNASSVTWRVMRRIRAVSSWRHCKRRSAKLNKRPSKTQGNFKWSVCQWTGGNVRIFRFL
jgi:hypothetical protein